MLPGFGGRSGAGECNGEVGVVREGELTLEMIGEFVKLVLFRGKDVGMWGGGAGGESMSRKGLVEGLPGIDRLGSPDRETGEGVVPFRLGPELLPLIPSRIRFKMTLEGSFSSSIRHGVRHSGHNLPGCLCQTSRRHFVQKVC